MYRLLTDERGSEIQFIRQQKSTKTKSDPSVLLLLWCQANWILGVSVDEPVAAAGGRITGCSVQKVAGLRCFFFLTVCVCVCVLWVGVLRVRRFQQEPALQWCSAMPHCCLHAVNKSWLSEDSTLKPLMFCPRLCLWDAVTSSQMSPVIPLNLFRSRIMPQRTGVRPGFSCEILTNSTASSYFQTNDNRITFEEELSKKTST